MKNIIHCSVYRKLMAVRVIEIKIWVKSPGCLALMKLVAHTILYNICG